MLKLFMLQVAAVIMAAAPVYAQSAPGSDDMINQLLPEKAGPASAPNPTVLSVATATKDEMIGRLGASASRSLDPHRPVLSMSDLQQGHEADALAALKGLPALQVAVAFQGSSDALAPEASVLLATLAQALSDPRLASSRFVVGVHTNSIGSNDYNVSLSTLRAKAIVDTLVAVHNLPRTRLVPLGFGRLVDPGLPTEVPAERIRVVNLGETPLVPGKVQVPVTLAAPGLMSDRHLDTRHAHGGRAVQSVARHRLARKHDDPAAGHAAALSHRHMLRNGVAAVRVRYPVRTSQSWRAGHVPVDRSAWPDADDTGVPLRASAAYSLPYIGGGHNGGGGNGGAGGGGSSSGGSSSGGSSSGGASSGGGAGGGAGGGSSSGGGWSDRRLKRNIKLLGRSSRGFSIYSFDYVWGGPTQVGVIAQEVAVACPEAVLVGLGGYLRVDYSKLDVTMMPLAQWRRSPLGAVLIG